MDCLDIKRLTSHHSLVVLKMFLASSAAQKPNLPMEKEVLRLSSGVRVERHGQSYAASSLVLTPYHISVYDDQVYM